MNIRNSHYKREQDYWDGRGAEEYISLSVSDQQRLGEWVKWKGRGRILDLGGGSGMMSRLFMHSPETDCVCLDISHKLLKYSPVPSVQADAFNLPFGDSSFDLIVAAAFLHHLPNKEVELLKECYRVLVPGGSLVGYDPNGHCFQNRLFMADGPFRLKTFSPDEKPVFPEKLCNNALEATFNKCEYFFFTFRNKKLTIFEFIQRYLLNCFSFGKIKRYLARWFFWKTNKPL